MNGPDRETRNSSRLDANDHDLGGLHQRSGGLAFAQLHFAHGIGGDDRGNLLVSDGEHNFCEQAADPDFNDFPDQLVTPAEVSEARSGFGFSL